MDPVNTGLIHRIEDEFGISVSAGEAQRVRTARDLHTLLIGKLNREDSRLRSHALYQTRQALADGLNVPRHGIAPETRLSELVPPAERAQRWNTIARSAGGPFPRLRHSRRLQDQVMLASVALSSLPVLALWWALYELDWLRGLWILVFAIPAAVAFLLIESRVDRDLLRATIRWATELPCETVQQLAEELAGLNLPISHAGPESGRTLSSEDVWARLSTAIQQSGACEHAIIMPGTPIPELENAQ